MKKYLYLFVTFSLLLSCNETKEPEPEPQPLEPEPCDCIGELTANAVFDCECTNPPTGILVWNYPDLSGLGWREQEAACQIPEEILFSLTTEELTEICLKYPFLRTYTISWGETISFISLYHAFNGIRELFGREDAVKELLRHYNCEVQKITSSSYFKDDYIFTLEALLGLYMQRFWSLKQDIYMDILQSLVAGYEKEIVYYYPNTTGWVYITNLLARAHATVNISPKCFEVFPNGNRNGYFYYIKSYGISDKSVDIINELSYCITNQYKDL